MADPAPGPATVDDVAYSGPATVTVDGRDVAVHARLDSRHEPVDGRLHWFGRLTETGPEPVLPALLGGRVAQAHLSTPQGSAPARIGDVDPWGRYRVTGTGPTPYAVHTPVLDD